MFFMILTCNDKEHTVDVDAHSFVNVRLEENPTTGYRWEVETAEGLTLVSDSFEPGGLLPGAAGMRVFQFRVPDAGTHNLSIKNWREWKGDSSIISRYYVTIVVKSKINKKQNKENLL